MQEERTATVQSVNLLALDEPTPVFNFEVEDCHTYFVGECCILIHSCVAALSGAEFFPYHNLKQFVNKTISFIFLLTIPSRRVIMKQKVPQFTKGELQ